MTVPPKDSVAPTVVLVTVEGAVNVTAEFTLTLPAAFVPVSAVAPLSESVPPVIVPSLIEAVEKILLPARVSVPAPSFCSVVVAVMAWVRVVAPAPAKVRPRLPALRRLSRARVPPLLVIVPAAPEIVRLVTLMVPPSALESAVAPPVSVSVVVPPKV